MGLRLRIAFLVDTFTVLTKGGRQAAGLARALRRAGHTVALFGAPSGSLRGQAEERASRDRRVAAFGPDVVVAWDAVSPAAWIGARCARRHLAPLVVVEPGSFAAGSLFERTLWRLGETLWGRRVRSSLALLLATDPEAREHALAQGFDPGRIETFLPGVDVERYRPGLATPAAARRIRGRKLCYVGSLEASRGVEVLLAAFARTVGRRGDWSLVVAGSGDGRDALRRQARRLGVAASVHVLDPPAPEDLPGLISSATLLAVPALDDSVRGIHIPHALAAGTPVVASDRRRFHDLIIPERTGLLVPAGDVESWAEALARAVAAPNLRRRLARAGRRLAEEELAWPRAAQRFEAALGRALADAPTCPARGPARDPATRWPA